MNILLGFLLPVIIVYVVITFASVLTLCWNWKHYKRVYDTLKDKKFYMGLLNMVFDKKFDPINPDAYGFVWFVDRDSFELTHKVYLHNNLVTRLDPYSLYWWLKYKKFFRGMDVKKLESVI